MRIVVIGVGNSFRSDDGAGLEVARLIADAAIPGVEVHQSDGEPARLIELWDGARLVYLVDAVSGPGDPGDVHRFEIADGSLADLPGRPGMDGTHALRLGDAVELARALGRLPARLVVVGVEGTDFRTGTGLSPAVAAAVARVAERIAAEATGPA